MNPGTGIATAAGLDFPKTEAEIVEALSQDDAKKITVTNGIKYVAEKRQSLQNHRWKAF